MWRHVVQLERHLRPQALEAIEVEQDLPRQREGRHAAQRAAPLGAFLQRPLAGEGWPGHLEQTGRLRCCRQHGQFFRQRLTQLEPSEPLIGEIDRMPSGIAQFHPVLIRILAPARRIEQPELHGPHLGVLLNHIHRQAMALRAPEGLSGRPG